MANVSITYTTRGRLPRVVFSRMKEKILGNRYDLSVVLVDKRRMQHTNATFRKKNEVTDVLAFPFSKHSGEIFLHLPTVRRKAHDFGLSEEEYLAYVFIHALLHLKGCVHGRTMEKLEDTWSVVFGVPSPARHTTARSPKKHHGATHRSRH